MSINNKPLVITLNKVPNGYTFCSIAELNNSKDKNKKQKPSVQKNPNNRVPNRLIK